MPLFDLTVFFSRVLCGPISLNSEMFQENSTGIRQGSLESITTMETYLFYFEVNSSTVSSALTCHLLKHDHLLMFLLLMKHYYFLFSKSPAHVHMFKRQAQQKTNPGASSSNLTIKPVTFVRINISKLIFLKQATKGSQVL